MNSKIISAVCVAFLTLAAACMDDPEKAQEHYDLALEYQESGQVANAIEEYTKAIEAFPAQYQSYYNRIHM